MGIMFANVRFENGGDCKYLKKYVICESLNVWVHCKHIVNK